jgi:hypothetical protein
MIRTQIQLTEEQYKFLREKAAEYNISMASLIREGVDLLLAQQGKPSRDELVKRAKEITGKYKDIHGARDVSVNHDKYLAEIYAQTGAANHDPD